MTYIDLKDLEYYIGCNQDNNYFYNINNNSIYNAGKISSGLSISEEEFIENCFYYEYIPLPGLNIAAIFDGFIKSLNNKKISKHFKQMNKENALEYWLEFDNMFHVGFERRLWDEYYDNCVHEKAINWCNEYHINYK